MHKRHEEAMGEPDDVEDAVEDVARLLGADSPEMISEVAESAAIPKDPRQRIVQVPIPKDVNGKPVCTVEDLDTEFRLALAANHDAKIKKNLIDRNDIIELAEHDESFRTYAKEMCAKDYVWFFNNFIWTLDPREGKGAVPFVLYTEQEDSVRFWQREFVPRARTPDGMVVLEEKSRGIGATWEKAGETVASFLFDRDFSALVSMVIEDDIDDGGLESTPDTFFGKFRFILERLPSWLVPGDVCTNKALNKIRSIKNPENGCYLKGRQYCGNIGRGRRYTVYLGDEFASTDKAEAAARSFSQTTKGVYLFFTPEGMDNEAARMRFGDTKRVVRTRHWTLNPYWTVDTYWNEVAKWGKTKCASQLDINYHESTQRKILIDFEPEKHIVYATASDVSERDNDGILVEPHGALDYDKNLPLSVMMDPGFGDAFPIIWAQRHEGYREYRFIDFIQYTRVKAEFLVPFLIGRIPEVTILGKRWPYSYSELERAIITRHGKWGAPDEAVGDSIGAASSLLTGNFSTYDLFEQYGLCPVYPVKIRNKLDAVDTVVQAVPRMRFAPRCDTQRTQSKVTPTLIECFRHWAWKPPPKGVRGTFKREPEHSIYCHAMDAVQAWMLNEDVTAPDMIPTPGTKLREIWEKRGLRREQGGRLGEHDEGGVHETADAADFDGLTDGEEY